MTDALQTYTLAYKEHISIAIFLYADCEYCYVTLFIKVSLNTWIWLLCLLKLYMAVDLPRTLKTVKLLHSVSLNMFLAGRT